LSLLHLLFNPVVPCSPSPPTFPSCASMVSPSPSTIYREAFFLPSVPPVFSSSPISTRAHILDACPFTTPFPSLFSWFLFVFSAPLLSHAILLASEGFGALSPDCGFPKRCDLSIQIQSPPRQSKFHPRGYTSLSCPPLAVSSFYRVVHF